MIVGKLEDQLSQLQTNLDDTKLQMQRLQSEITERIEAERNIKIQLTNGTLLFT
jgi:capsule polysaccharide export protein KpsE/RkpR